MAKRGTSQAPKRATTPARTVLADVLARLDVRDRLREYRVWQVWDEAVGEILAARTEPVRIENGRLIVRVADAVWMQEIQFLKDEVRRKVNAAVGERVVKSLFLIQGDITPKAARGEVTTHEVDEAEVEAVVPADTPPEIAEALRRIARACMRRFGSLAD